MGNAIRMILYIVIMEECNMWNKVKENMEIIGLNQEQLAKKMGIHSGTISDLKMGRIKKPSFELACKLADALEIKVDDLR